MPAPLRSRDYIGQDTASTAGEPAFELWKLA